MHHLSTVERREKAIRSILDVLRPTQPSSVGGKALIYVWALEQKNSRRGWDKGDEQDIMVPWVRKSATEPNKSQTFNRYYHLFQEGELESDIQMAGGDVVRSGYEKDNWWAIATPKIK